MSEVKGRGWLNEKTIILLPEYFGTWLILTDDDGL